jgi:LysR family hydrogen peroxide-inducible transcriptional activator
MDSRDLQYVLVIDEMGSFSKAAEKLYISQPSLSQYIHRLEKRLGRELFYRDKSQVMLTPFGKIYAEEAQKVLAQMDRMEYRLSQVKEDGSHEIRIGLSTSYSKFLLPTILSTLQQLYPHTNITFIDGVSTLLEKQILEGRITLGIFPMPPLQNETASILLYREPLYFAVCQDNKKAMELLRTAWDGHRVDLRVFRDFPFVLLTRSAKLRDHMVHICEEFGFQPKPICESETQDTLYSLVNHNYGVGFLSLTLLQNVDKTNNRVLFFPVEDDSSCLNWGIFYRRGKRQDSAMRAVAKALRKQIGESFNAIEHYLAKQNITFEAMQKNK